MRTSPDVLVGLGGQGTIDCRTNSDDLACNERKRRDTGMGCDDENDNCVMNRKRRETESEACAACKLNSDYTLFFFYKKPTAWRVGSTFLENSRF